MPQAKEGIGAFIKSTRDNRGLTQAQLALYTGITQSEISRIESGQRQQPAPEYLRKIADVLTTPVRQLMVIAGYLEEDEPETLTPMERVEHALNGLNEFTVDEVEDILAFIEFTGLRKKQKTAQQEQNREAGKVREEEERQRLLAERKQGN